jgi:hypothetical protein
MALSQPSVRTTLLNSGAKQGLVDACIYVLRMGCAWTQLPKCFPPWLAVHKSFGRFAAQGTGSAKVERGTVPARPSPRLPILATPKAAEQAMVGTMHHDGPVLYCDAA